MTTIAVHAPGGRPPPRQSEDAAHTFTLSVDLEEGLRQRVDFESAGVASLVVDEPPPLGTGEGPNPARLLGAAVASCLGASLAFCLRKARIELCGLRSSVRGTISRNERGRLRVSRIEVLLEPVIPTEFHDRAARCVAVFEDFCTVTGSVRDAIDVSVETRIQGC